MAESPISGLLSIDETIAYLGISRSYFFSTIRKNQLIPYVKMGRRVLYERDALDKFIAASSTYAA